MTQKISIITPCRNAEAHIAETIHSVINNSAIRNGRAILEYILCDGASDDDTVKKAEEIFSQIRSDNIATHIISEPDDGMYDALCKGMERSSGDIYAYINAGDFYSPYAFDIVLDIFEQHGTRWLTGLNVTYNEFSQIIGANLAFRYRRRLVQRGLYGPVLPYMQQESIFWDASLNDTVDFDALRRFRYAGDYFLWHTFSEREELSIVEAWLGGFKYHHTNLSSDMGRYRQEMRSFTKRATPFDYLLAGIDFLIWNSPPKLKKMLNKKNLYRYNVERAAFV